MEVILLERVHNLGNLGDKVRVRAGYGRNFLIPKKQAVPATPENVEKFEARRSELEKAQSDALAAAQARANALTDMGVTIAAKVGSEGKLYGSIGTAEIAEVVSAAGQTIEKREVQLPDGPLREVGEHEVVLRLHADTETKIMVTIVADDDAPGDASD